MTAISQISLPHLEMDKESFAQNPWPHFETARATHPWLATCAFGHVITQYDAM